MTYDARHDIAVSIAENRTVTLRPSTRAEQEAMDEALLAECEDSADHAKVVSHRGYIHYWGDIDGAQWSVSVVDAND